MFSSSFRVAFSKFPFATLTPSSAFLALVAGGRLIALRCTTLHGLGAVSHAVPSAVAAEAQAPLMAVGAHVVVARHWGTFGVGVRGHLGRATILGTGVVVGPARGAAVVAHSCQLAARRLHLTQQGACMARGGSASDTKEVMYDTSESKVDHRWLVLGLTLNRFFSSGFSPQRKRKILSVSV